MAVSLLDNPKDSIYQRPEFEAGDTEMWVYECDGHDHDWVVRSEALRQNNPVEFCANCRRTKSEVIAQSLKHR